MFCCAIHVATGVNFTSCNAADIYNVSFTLFDHHRGNGPCDVKQSFYIGVDHLFPVVDISFLNGVETCGKPCIVDKDLYVLPFCGKVLYEFVNFLSFPDIKSSIKNANTIFVAQFSGNVFQPVSSSSGDDQVMFVFRKFFSTGQSDAGCCPCDQCNFIHFFLDLKLTCDKSNRKYLKSLFFYKYFSPIVNVFVR